MKIDELSQTIGEALSAAAYGLFLAYLLVRICSGE